MTGEIKGVQNIWIGIFSNPCTNIVKNSVNCNVYY